VIIGDGPRPLIVPGCCRSSLYHPAVTLRWKPHCDMEKDAPVWTASIPASFTEAIDMREYVAQALHRTHFEVACCPFCGTPVPEVVQREVPAGVSIFVPDRGYEHCGTCGERSCNCICLDPLVLWAPVDPEPMLRERYVLVHPERGVFLAFSEPDREEIWSQVNIDHWHVWTAKTATSPSVWLEGTPDLDTKGCEAVPVLTGNVFERAHAFECALAGCPPWQPRWEDEPCE